jgi:hypothetical protein
MKVEIRALSALDPAIAHLDAVFRESQHIWAGYADGDLVVVWGLSPASILSTTAYIWSWTRSAAKCRKTFVRLSREVVAEMLKEYPTLVGLCEEKSHWLCWLGAKFGGLNGRYISFMIEG